MEVMSYISLFDFLIFVFEAGMHIYSRAAAKGKRVQVDALSLSFLLSIVKLFLSTHNNDKVAQLTKFVLQSNMGAKNHAIVMPDASVDATINALIAAGF